jgi:hypothetical protein
VPGVTVLVEAELVVEVPVEPLPSVAELVSGVEEQAASSIAAATAVTILNFMG